MGERAQAIAAELRRLGRLAERLLQLSRAEAGVVLGGELVDLVPLAQLLVDDFRRQPAMAGRLHFDTGGQESLMVRGDMDALGIALRNLLENAALHGDPAAPITLRLGPGRCLSLRNGAAVIPAATLTRLKEPFHRLDNHASGTGLGLAIVEMIMRQAGGALLLHSPPPGAASGFEAVLNFPEP